MQYTEWKCECGHRTAVLPGIPIVCSHCKGKAPAIPGEPVIPELGLITKSRNYVKELKRWLSAGRPVREPEEVERIQSLCRECPKFNGSVCTLCGCPVLNPSILGNKILWATSSCPDTPKRWTTDYD